LCPKFPELQINRFGFHFGFRPFLGKRRPDWAEAPWGEPAKKEKAGTTKKKKKKKQKKKQKKPAWAGF